MKAGYIYIMASRHHGTLYVGVTSNIVKRVYEHKQGLVDGFTKKYDIKNLVHYETYDDIESAILHEKKLKHLKRQKKIEIVEKDNPNWSDLYDRLI